MKGQAEFNFDAEPLDEVEPPQPASTASASMLERIRKLLRLAANEAASAAEAERAAAMAFELAERHHVDLASLSLDEKTEKLVGERFGGCGRIDRLRGSVICLVRDYFNVEVCVSAPDVLFVGRETDVAVAGYMYDFLMRTGRACAKLYEQNEKLARRKMTALKRNNYAAGFCWGIADQLGKTRATIALTDSQRALVLVEKQAREEKMSEMMPNMTTRKVKPIKIVRSAAMAGFVDGRSTQINKPVGGTKAMALEDKP